MYTKETDTDNTYMYMLELELILCTCIHTTNVCVYNRIIHLNWCEECDGSHHTY